MEGNSFEHFGFDKTEENINGDVESESLSEDIQETEKAIVELLYRQEGEVGSEIFKEGKNSLQGIKESVVYQNKKNIELDSLSDNRIFLATLDKVFEEQGGFKDVEYSEIYKKLLVRYAKERIDELDFSLEENKDLDLYNGLDKIIEEMKEKLEGKEIISDNEFNEIKKDIDSHFENKLKEVTSEE